MKIIKREQFTATLPPTPCTPEMRAKIALLAKKEGASLAEVQRSAFQFFLDMADNLVITPATMPIKESTE